MEMGLVSFSLSDVIADMYNHTNPDLNTHAPIIAKETYDIVMAHAEVDIHPGLDEDEIHLFVFLETQCSSET